MRNVKLFENVLASNTQTSIEINLPMRTEWILRVNSSSLNGTPKIYIEEGFGSGKTPPNQYDWNVLPNKCSDSDAFDITDSEVRIRSNHFVANWFRVRLEPNDNTSGIMTVILSYKDYV